MLRFAILLAAAVTAPPFTLKGLALGSSIDQVKALPLPADRYGPVRMDCSDTSPLNNVKPDKPLADAGVVRCHATQEIGGSRVFADIPLLGDVSDYVDFFYLNGHLYRVEVAADIENADTIAKALAQKYGPPTKTETGDFQVRSGAKFPQRRLIWLHGSQRLTFTAPDLSTERLTITYDESAVSTGLRARVDAAAARASDL